MAHVAVVDRVGTGVLGLFESVGSIATFGGRAIVEAVRPPYEPREILRHLFQFGRNGVALAVILPKAVLERATSLTSARAPTNGPQQPSSRSTQ